MRRPKNEQKQRKQAVWNFFMHETSVLSKWLKIEDWVSKLNGVCDLSLLSHGLFERKEVLRFLTTESVFSVSCFGELDVERTPCPPLPPRLLFKFEWRDETSNTRARQVAVLVYAISPDTDEKYMVETPSMTDIMCSTCVHDGQSTLEHVGLIATTTEDAKGSFSMHSLCYLDSGEAEKLLDPIDGEETSLDALNSHLQLLGNAADVDDGWKNVVESDPALYSENQVSYIKTKARYLATALLYLKEEGLVVNPPVRVTWTSCCNLAISHMRKSWFNFIEEGRARTLMEWFRQYRKNRRRFPHPYHPPYVHKSCAIRSPFLLMNPDIVEVIKCEGNTNLDKLSVDFLHEFIHDKVLPPLLAQANKSIEPKPNHRAITKEDFLIGYGLKNLCKSTVNNWMLQLGFKYKEHTKSYYVDGHEKADTIMYRKQYICRYFKEYEPRMFRWVHLTKKEVDVLKSTKQVSANGFHFMTDVGEVRK